MREKLKSREIDSALMSAYGKKRILLFAEAYHELARSFEESKNLAEPFGSDRREHIYRKQIYESRRIMARRMQDIAEQMNGLAGETKTCRVPAKNQVKQLTNHLKKHGIILKEIFYTGCDGTNFYLTMKGMRNADYTTEDVAEVLSNMFDVSLVSARENLFFVAYEPDCYKFEAIPKYCIHCGVAKATKENESISGDNNAFYENTAKGYYAILSDGAGSGTEACKDSEMVLELFEKYLDTGFGMNEAADMVNGLLLAEGRELNMPTLDVCYVDLESAKASFVKYGSADSYICRGEEIFKIRNVGFPLGFCDSSENSTDMEILNEKERAEYLIESGDYIVLVSDGVADAVDDENTLLQIFRYANTNSVSDYANYVLASVVRNTGGRIRDDMTVLVMQLRECEQKLSSNSLDG